MHTERPLVEAVLHRGDERAFRELYRLHTPRLYQFVLRVLGGSETDAEDVVQETWVRACEGLARFRWDSRFGTWLLAIGLNTAREQVRKRRRTSHGALDPEAGPPVPVRPPGELIDLERAISVLPDGYRTVFLLHDVEGYTHEEISRSLGVAVGTSKSQLFWARRAIRSLLRPALGGTSDGRAPEPERA